MSTQRDADFDWRIRIRGMTEDEVAEVIEKTEAQRAEARRERDAYRADLATAEGLLREWMEGGDPEPVWRKTGPFLARRDGEGAP